MVKTKQWPDHILGHHHKRSSDAATPSTLAKLLQKWRFILPYIYLSTPTSSFHKAAINSYKIRGIQQSSCRTRSGNLQKTRRVFCHGDEEDLLRHHCGCSSFHERRRGR
ncbi:hypothetical protein SAY87_009174 [Trapa incisa]|uniref:Uncharacterized protein n=1 Tax=Trapa incisa TaxID=236973 RepID=A0AAN7PWG7_9MYRT|nr:hypothetical protein SAY87_009174 [Trapa incisa]